MYWTIKFQECSLLTWLVRMTELVLPEGLLAIIYTESWRPNDLMELYKDR